MAKTSLSSARGMCLIPGLGAIIKDPDAGKDQGQKEKGVSEDEMVR